MPYLFWLIGIRFDLKRRKARHMISKQRNNAGTNFLKEFQGV